MHANTQTRTHIHVLTHVHACMAVYTHTRARAAPRLHPSRRRGSDAELLSSITQPAAPSEGAGDGARGGSAPGAEPGHTRPLGWHILARAPWHAVAQSGGQMLPKPARGPGNGGFSTFPLPRGAQAPSIPWPGVAGPTWTTARIRAAPVPAVPVPWDPPSPNRSRAAMPLGVPPRARLSPLLPTSPSPKDGAVKSSAEPRAFITP